ncbi:MAG: tRNA-(ms[2]io[6]A)-hydroxylase [Sinobacterium sp.]|nr:tRNA-(ms[2]io[6]A)-hydroxylase [Sinobacterium sp.]
MKTIPDLHDFLPCETPDSWVQAALKNQHIMLVDHANCEKKAASTALTLMNRCFDKPDVLNKMSKLAREELRHFEQVTAIMKKRGLEYVSISSSRYAKGLHKYVPKNEPERLVHTLIVGAFIEARSCERFEKIAPFLDEELAKFYTSLLKSESRHFQDYLKLAIKYSDESIDELVQFYAEKEKLLIESDDTEFRFHSGAYAPKHA